MCDMNVTLSLDDRLVRNLSRIAAERGTTLTALIRDYLVQLVEENVASGRREREALRQSFSEFKFHVRKRTWKRQDLYDQS